MGFQEDRICALDLLFHLKPLMFWPIQTTASPCRQESRGSRVQLLRRRSRGVEPVYHPDHEGLANQRCRGDPWVQLNGARNSFSRPRNSKVPRLRVGQTTMSFGERSSSSTLCAMRQGARVRFRIRHGRVLPHQQIGLRHSCEALCASRVVHYSLREQVECLSSSRGALIPLINPLRYNS